MSADLNDLQPEALQRARQALAIAQYFDIKVVVTNVKPTALELLIAGNRGEESGRGPVGHKPHRCLEFHKRRRYDPHNYGLAWDSLTIDPDQAKQWVRIRRFVGWLVHSKEPMHAEVPSAQAAIRELQAIGGQGPS